MLLKIALNLKFLVADTTHKHLTGLPSLVRSDVFQIERPVPKPPLTELALERLVPCVHSDVLGKVRGPVAGLGAVGADVSLLLLCVLLHALDILLHVPSEGESLSTGGALVWPVLTVGCLVLPQITSILELFLARGAGERLVLRVALHVASQG